MDAVVKKLKLSIKNTPGIKRNVEHFQRHFLSLFILWSILFFIISLAAFIVLNKKYESSFENSKNNAYKYYYWKKVVLDHPNFPDALVQAALYADSLGYYEEAVEYLNSAQLQDPASEEIVQLKGKILKRNR